MSLASVFDGILELIPGYSTAFPLSRNMAIFLSMGPNRMVVKGKGERLLLAIV